MNIINYFYTFTFTGVFKVLVIVSSLFLFTSIIMLILSTLPEFQVLSCQYLISVFLPYTKLQEVSEAGVEEENFFFRSTEAIFVGWFTLEFLIRFVVSPSKVLAY